MEKIQTHPSNAAQAKNFIAPGSLSFPGGAGDLTPPSLENENHKYSQASSSNSPVSNNGLGATPATPAATPSTTQGVTSGVSGIVPTLQYV